MGTQYTLEKVFSQERTCEVAVGESLGKLWAGVQGNQRRGRRQGQRIKL